MYVYIYIYTGASYCRVLRIQGIQGTGWVPWRAVQRSSAPRRPEGPGAKRQAKPGEATGEAVK